MFHKLNTFSPSTYMNKIISITLKNIVGAYVNIND